MEVEEPSHWHFDHTEDDSLRVMLSEQWAKRFKEARSSVWRLIESGAVSFNIDLFERLADTLVGWLSLSFDFGPVSMKICLFALALYEICNRLVVTGYEIVSYPARFGVARFGSSRFGQGGYGIEPVTLD